MLEKKRLYYIDGLKGICCICICILHFLLMFIPKGYIGWGCSAEASENPFDFYFADFPFSIFTNGSFALYVFMALISFIPAYSFFNTGKMILLQSRRASDISGFCRWFLFRALFLPC